MFLFLGTGGTFIFMEKVSYALGLSLGNNLLSSGINNLDFAKLAKGIQDVLEQNEPEISYQEAQATINEFFEALQAKASEGAIKAGQDFLAENAKRAEVVTLASGLQYEVLQMGKGPKPTAEDSVQVNYVGTLFNGKAVDSSADHGGPAEFALPHLVQGWSEGVQLMPVGSRFKFYIPSNLAWGANGAGEKIPPNTPVIFEVELLKIVSKKK